MRATIIAAGTVFGKLTVIERAGTSSDGKAMWLCSCSCGSEPRAYTGKNLRNGTTKSCGCLTREKAASRRQDLVGKVYNRLTVISPKILEDGTFSGKWNCLCQCGNYTEVTTARLNNGHTQSCGCLGIDRSREVCGTHLMRHTTEYAVWDNMKARCFNPNNSNYPRYGGRGITVCDEWKDSFESFYADMGPKPAGCSLDRINNDGNYCKENCRWADSVTQANNKSNNRMLSAFGKTQTMANWARDCGLTSNCLESRLKHGWGIEKALTTPSKGRVKYERNL